MFGVSWLEDEQHSPCALSSLREDFFLSFSFLLFTDVLQNWPVLPGDSKDTRETFFFNYFFASNQVDFCFLTKAGICLLLTPIYKELGLTVEVDTSDKTRAVSVNNTSFTPL